MFVLTSGKGNRYSDRVEMYFVSLYTSTYLFLGGGGGGVVQSLKLSLNTVLSVMMNESKICWSHSKLIIFFMV